MNVVYVVGQGGLKEKAGALKKEVRYSVSVLLSYFQSSTNRVPLLIEKLR